MKNLSKTVDKILKIEPSLGEKLIPIKEKWERSARKIYWKQLLMILNSEITSQHPNRHEIQKLFVPKKGQRKRFYTFDPVGPTENIVGVIPENMECLFRKFDLMGVDLAKKAIEARMTRNKSLMIQVNKMGEDLDIKQRKLWVELKNHFNLWDVPVPTTFSIRSKDTMLVLTSSPAQDPGPGPSSSPTDDLRKLFRLLPPNLLPPSEPDNG